MRIALLASLATLLTAASSAAPPVLGLPIACKPGSTCFVQQYFDHDPGPGAKDYRCGGRVYDGHDGVDIRLPSMAAQRRGVAVLAAAAGVVEGMRDGMDDVAIDDGDRAAIAGRECGNGAVIRHDGGWRTQYCHLAKGSVVVRKGQTVAAGQKLGLVGLSGDTQFPHVHLSVREGDARIDPFAPTLAPGACMAESPGKGLWSPNAAAALAYRSTEIINFGFADSPVAMTALDDETLRMPDAASPAIVFYGRAIGLQGGDTVRVTVTGPDGAVLVRSDTPIERAKAQWLSFAGDRRPSGGWPRGAYKGSWAVLRGGTVVAIKTASLPL